MGNTFIRNEGDFNYTDFTSTAGLTLSGDAVSPGATIELVSGAILEEGAVWTNDKVPVGLGFEVTFDFSLQTTNAGADGLSFVIQNNSPSPPLSDGGTMGYTGIFNSLAVEFDTWLNDEFSPPEANGNHISVQTRGPNLPNDADPQYSIGADYSLSATLDNGATHTARIVYDPSNDSLQVYLNGTLEVQISPFDLEDHLNLDDGAAWVGIMSTSGTAASHRALLLNFRCTLQRTIVIVLSGEKIGNPSDNIATGIFEWGMGLRDDPQGRYFAAMFNEDAVDNKGAGRVHKWIKIGLEEGWFAGITRFAFVGHSHGGGSVHDLADYLTVHVDNADLRADFPFEIVMTGYVDAIGQSFPFGVCETRLPPGTAYHVNLYQRLPFHPISNKFRGCTMTADVNLDVNAVLTCVSGTVHGQIDDCEVVLRILDRNLDLAASGDPLNANYCEGGLTCNN